MSKKKNVLVTGGAGYIGSVVSTQLIEAGHMVIVLDNLSHGYRQAIHPEASFIEADIKPGNLHLLETILADYHIDAVLHFAAFIEAGESMKDPASFFQNNTVNTLTLLKAMLNQKVHKFVFSSTAAVYGNPSKIPIVEDAPFEPTNYYGRSKLMVEQVLEAYNHAYKFSYVALRYFNASGATDTLGENHRPETHLIPLAMQTALGKRAKLKIYGTDYPTNDGTCVRDYIHVSDLARAHLMALEALSEDKGKRYIYNLGNGKGFSIRQVIQAVEKVTGRQIPVEEAPRRVGDPAILIASSEKITQELGWKPKYSDIEQIIETAWVWLQKYPKGYAG